jgi:DNA topoisomerase I
VLAAKALAETPEFESNAAAKRNVLSAIESVAKRLGNTKAVCRKCYIHPAILDAYMDGATISTVKARARTMLNSAEASVAKLIEHRLRRKTA